MWLRWWFTFDVGHRTHFNNMTEVLSDDNLNVDEKLEAVEAGAMQLIKFIDTQNDAFEDLWLVTFPDLKLDELFEEFKENELHTDLKKNYRDFKIIYRPINEPLHHLFVDRAIMPIDRFGLVFLNGAQKIFIILN